MPNFQVPTLNTARLILRSPSLEDAPDIQELAGRKEIAANTLAIPHPYLDGMAQEWIEEVNTTNRRGSGATFTIIIRDSNALCGAIGLAIDPDDNRAMLCYWIGKPYWGQGYCTEAAKAVLDYGFNRRKLHRIYAGHFSRNPASGKVMKKLGMTYEGCYRQHILKEDRYEDLVLYGILKSEFMTGMGSHERS